MRFINRPARVQQQRRRGTTVVEFAVVAPVAFLFIFGLVEFGRAMMVQQALISAAREGCREATLATTQSSTEVDTVVRDFMQAVTSVASDPAKLLVDLEPASLSDISSGETITVKVEVAFDDVSWLPGNFLGAMGNPMLRAKSTQKRE